MLKLVRILCPVQASRMRVELEQVNALRVLPCLDEDKVITALQEELPAYLVAASDAVLHEMTRLKWWKQQSKLPAWQHVARIVFALVPSSAPAEHAFSLLQSSFNQLQRNTLVDQIELSLMLQYNRRPNAQ